MIKQEELLRKFRDGIDYIPDASNLRVKTDPHSHGNEPNDRYVRAVGLGELVIHRTEGNMMHYNRPWFLLNADQPRARFGHGQWLSFGIFKDWPRVSFTAIRAAGLDPFTAILIDYTPDLNEYNKTNADGSPKWPSDISRDEFYRKYKHLGTVHEEVYDDIEDTRQQSVHSVGRVLLEHPDTGIQYICATDERRYFVSMLPLKYTTVYDAIEGLKPPIIRELEGYGFSYVDEGHAPEGDIKRQGEWFFADTFLTMAQFKEMFNVPFCAWKSGILPATPKSSNRHHVSKMVTYNNQLYCLGYIRHRNMRGYKSYEHWTPILKTVHIPYRNTSLGDWSAEGRVD
jgi:hypothetical protein